MSFAFLFLLSIIITHHHTPDLLNKCLQSLRGVLENIKHEIIVCDNQCAGKSCLKQSWPEVKFYCFEENLGYTRLVNYGLAQARGDYLLILNADIVLSDNSVNLMIDYLSHHPEVGLLGPRLVDADQQRQPSCFREYNFWNMAARRTIFGRTRQGRQLVSRLCCQDLDLNQIQPVPWLMGAALLTSRRILKTVGPLDERFLMYFSDADWARRCWQKGLKVVYFPQVYMTHWHQRSSRQGHGIFDIFYNRLTRVHFIDAMKYFWKWKNKRIR